MTREEATQIIAESLGSPANGAQLAENQSYAQRLATALDALGLIQPTAAQAIATHAQQQSQADPQQPTHHKTDAQGTVSTPHPMQESRHGITPGPSAAEASWRRQPQPTPDDTPGAA